MWGTLPEARLWYPCDTVHPHACGEHSIASTSVFADLGSSPRMWGTLGVPNPCLLIVRFIPTHVGNTRRGSATGNSVAVHPHACGEHCGVWSVSPGDPGSSPRMWGTQPGACRPLCDNRFIPTHVGNTSAGTAPKNRADTVHPHACGEHDVLALPVEAHPGSSPRMWGTLKRSRPRPASRRFIPTHVGNTNDKEIINVCLVVHPHACGEHAIIHRVYLSDHGSSPRMWGTRHIPDRYHQFPRFIPTHVGNTYNSPIRNNRHAVHPHACGEHITIHQK